MSRGESETDIMDMLGLDTETYRAAVKYMLNDRAEAKRKEPREHTYIRYVIDQTKNITDLNDLISNLDSKNQYNALVGAIRLRSDIQDKIIAKGQEFGLIQKEAQKHELVGGLAIAHMTLDDLQNTIKEQTMEAMKLTSRYGAKGLLDLPPGPTHYGESVVVADAQEVREGERAKAKAAATTKKKKKRRKG